MTEINMVCVWNLICVQTYFMYRWCARESGFCLFIRLFVRNFILGSCPYNFFEKEMTHSRIALYWAWGSWKCTLLMWLCLETTWLRSKPVVCHSEKNEASLLLHWPNCREEKKLTHKTRRAVPESIFIKCIGILWLANYARGRIGDDELLLISRAF